jgi:hypothetical protein
VSNRRGLFIVGLVGGVLIAAVAPLVLLGLYVRPTSDDWCLVPLARTGGFGAVVSNIYQSQNGRLGNAAVNGLVFTTYGVSSRVLPGVLLVLLVLTFFGIWRAVLRYALGAEELVASVGGAALAAGTVLAVLLGKPHQYQTLYHAPTIISHTMPILIAAVILLGVLLFHRRGALWAASAVALLGGVFLGTFNEAFTGVCLVSMVAGLVLYRLFPRHAVHWVVVLSGGIGLLLGFASVYWSPGSANRQQLIHGGSPFRLHLISQTVTSWARIVGSALFSGEGLLLLLVAVAVGVLLGADARRTVRHHSVRFYLAALVVPGLWAFFASLGATYVLAYSFNGQIMGRGRVFPSITVTAILGAAWYALLLGQLVAQRVAAGEGAARRRRLVVAGAVVSLPALALLAYGSLVLVRDERTLTTLTVVRSVAWDTQQAVLRAEIAGGARTITVRPLPIDGLMEPFYPRTSLRWPARCAPDFYGVDHVVRPPGPAS